MMKVSATSELCIFLFTSSCFLLFSSGLQFNSMPYDYSATIECVAEPRRAQYGGGIIVNPGFDDNINGWKVFGNGKIEERMSNDGNKFIVAGNRTQQLDSFSQKVQLNKGMIYIFSAWFQLSEGSDIVSAVFKINGSELVRGGHVIAKHGCWSLLKGGIVANFSSPADILFESENATVELWVDSVSLQPFTKEQWRSQQDKSIERLRKSRVRFQVTHPNKTALEGATVGINQTRPHFPFGCGMNHHILTNNDYQKCSDKAASPANYIKKLKQIQQFPGIDGISLAIGVQCHFASGQPNVAYMRSSLDLLAATGLPIWLTETSAAPHPNQAEYFEEILREGYSHPAVQGIIMFVGPKQAGFDSTLLADENFKNTPTGDVVDKLIREWGTGPHTAVADSRGVIDISLHHGDYDVTVTHPLTQYSKTLKISVRKGFSPDTINVKMNA
ncbi:hypothetical protein TSUD_331970 [Trifolium subterraneum]|uniref:GH10 domain-containing protein n=1 Tax=Trifolium subterraneum TaxID=3900 RepID=A0A2Z6MWA9_TRISU|nr:hypothetical protein TSUD_331970 [Trifolium subterraneum]